MIRSALITSIILLGFTFYSCQPEPAASELVRDMVVQTSFDQSANFSTYTTYSIPLDTIGQIYNEAPNDTIITGSYARLVTNVVNNNFARAGYNRVDRSQDPDVGINVFVIRDLTVSQYVSYPGNYGGYFGGYYGYSVFYGYPYVSTYISSSGTLIIEMVDLKNKDAQGNARVIWSAFIGDIITSIDRDAKTQEAVNQAFAQSPYLIKSAQ